MNEIAKKHILFLTNFKLNALDIISKKIVVCLGIRAIGEDFQFCRKYVTEK